MKLWSRFWVFVFRSDFFNQNSEDPLNIEGLNSKLTENHKDITPHTLNFNDEEALEIINDLSNIKLKYKCALKLNAVCPGIYPLFVKNMDFETSIKVINEIWKVDNKEKIKIYKYLNITDKNGKITWCYTILQLPSLPDYMEIEEFSDHYSITLKNIVDVFKEDSVKE